MKGKYTQGKWIMNVTEKYIESPGLAITSESGVLIAFVSHDLSDKSIDNYSANAELIRAAPELLEALKLLFIEVNDLKDHIIEQNLINWEDESIEGCKKLDEAIKQSNILINKLR